ncbi:MULTISPECIES: hypothetical protein [unclassified Streptomyces]|uniref:hypothetical protein n=1 Tax=unclassified Streptomyces TaxID=2593676 RepID=UPI00381DA121
MGDLPAPAPAVLYRLVDFGDRVLPRRTGFVTVTLPGRIGGLVLAVAAAPPPA